MKKKSFIIMTILGPVLFSALMLVPLWLAMQEESKHFIEVIDDSKLIEEFLSDDKNVKYDYPSISFEIADRDFYSTNYTALLWIPENILNSRKIILYFKDNPGIIVQEKIRSQIENILYENQLEEQGIDMKRVDAAHIPVNIITRKKSQSGGEEQTNTSVNMAIGFGAGILIYIFIFLYGAQVMRGVIEEKTSRIVEIIISSVRPFQLMMGKITGIAMVGLTQFVLWVVLTLILVGIGQVIFIDGQQTINYSKSAEILSNIQNINFIHILFAFLFYFLGGYLLYGAMFAAIGSAVDNEADTQQFMMPITIPLVVAIIVSQFVMQNPSGSLAFWFSIIPFTSPVVMMIRLPFGVPIWEFLLSMTLLVLTFIFMTWLAGKIYRTGILMYGKKVNYKELWKWLRYPE